MFCYASGRPVCCGSLFIIDKKNSSPRLDSTLLLDTKCMTSKLIYTYSIFFGFISVFVCVRYDYVLFCVCMLVY